MDKNQASTEMADRERLWHNELYGTDTRQKAEKFYSISKFCIRDYKNAIKDNGGPDRVGLEYGCGLGDYSLEHYKHFKKLEAIDICDEFIRYAKQEYAHVDESRLHYQTMDAMNMSFPDHCFDVIAGSAILHHLDLDNALAEIDRVLKPGGVGIFIEPLGTNPAIRLYRKCTPAMRTSDEHPFKRRDLKLIKKYFPGSVFVYYNFLTFLAVPFRNTKVFTPLITCLYMTDRFLFRFLPFTRYAAWNFIAQLKKQTHGKIAN